LGLALARLARDELFEWNRFSGNTLAEFGDFFHELESLCLAGFGTQLNEKSRDAIGIDCL
jgi:hypothetical protein